MIARATPFEVARALANRDDAMRPYQRAEIPKMEYPKLKMSPTAIWAFIRSFAP